MDYHQKHQVERRVKARQPAARRANARSGTPEEDAAHEPYSAVAVAATVVAVAVAVVVVGLFSH